jgi:hypothetical protein
MLPPGFLVGDRQSRRPSGHAVGEVAGGLGRFRSMLIYRVASINLPSDQRARTPRRVPQIG